MINAKRFSSKEVEKTLKEIREVFAKSPKRKYWSVMDRQLGKGKKVSIWKTYLRGL